MKCRGNPSDLSPGGRQNLAQGVSLGSAISERVPLGTEEITRMVPRSRLATNPSCSLHSIQNRSHNSSHDATLHVLRASLVRQVFIDRVRQLGNRERLQPDSARASERSQENSVAPENHVLDPRNGRDLKRHAGLKCADMPRMDPQSFSRLQIAHHEFAGEFKPCSALPAEPFQQKATAAKNTSAQRLLKPERNLNLRRGAHKAVAMNHVFASC